MNALDTRTAAQAREQGDTRAWLHLWMKASREGASEAKLQTIARGIAAPRSTGDIRAFLALVASVAGLIWIGGQFT